MQIPGWVRQAAGRVRLALPTVVIDAAAIAGAGSIAYGAWMAYPPAGFIMGGLLAVGAAVLRAPR